MLAVLAASWCWQAPADAHMMLAGLRGHGVGRLQLMLMMLAGLRDHGRLQLMLMMLASLRGHNVAGAS